MAQSFRFICVSCTFLFITSNVQAKVPDKLKLLEGCFDIKYTYSENNSNKVQPSSFTSREWIGFKEEGQTFKLSHYAKFAGRVVNHWQEVWESKKDNIWQQTILLRGQQRSRCEGPFVDDQWHCTIDEAPKPRRDTSPRIRDTNPREDYDKIKRDNYLTISKERNVLFSLILRTQKGKYVSVEAGTNVYTRLNEKECKHIKDGI